MAARLMTTLAVATYLALDAVALALFWSANRRLKSAKRILNEAERTIREQPLDAYTLPAGITVGDVVDEIQRRIPDSSLIGRAS